jgi:hypothetical protein
MARNKILHMSRPDQATLNFWKATADDHNEYFARIAKFSRALGKTARSMRRRAPAVRPANAGPLGRLLVMPSRNDHQLRGRRLDPQRWN